jgi:hypothetical protein
MTDALVHSFCAQQRAWLELELQSDPAQLPMTGAPQSEEVRSNVLHNLDVDDVSVGLYGKTVVRLVNAAVGGTWLPAHRFTTGDEVEIRSKGSMSKDNPGGVICEVTEMSISIALFSNNRSNNNKGANKKQQSTDENDEDWIDSGPFSLLPKSSIEVHKKLMLALEDLEKQGTNHPVAGHLVQALFEVPSDMHHRPITTPMTAFNNQLDDSQIEAISFALSSNRPVSLIHGPPGSKYKLLTRLHW